MKNDKIIKFGDKITKKLLCKIPQLMQNVDQQTNNK